MRIASVRALLLVVIAIGTFVVPGSAGAQSPGLLRDEPPLAGRLGPVVLVSDAAVNEVVATLRQAGCEPAALWLPGEPLPLTSSAHPRWFKYVPGAPAVLNAEFPQLLRAGTTLTVRCASEIEVRVANGDVTLVGTLSLPARRGPHPAVVLVSGSGGQDRDEAIPGMPGYQPFRWIADDLVERGVAVLRYDDRGIGLSTGEQAGATTADFATDAEAAIAFLRVRADIDAARVGVLGHSEGGVIAAMVAARDPELAFVVSMAGTAVPGEDLLMLQGLMMGEACGVERGELFQNLAGSQHLFGLIKAENWTELAAFVQEAATQQIAAMPPEVAAELDVDELVMGQMRELAGWVRFFMLHDPADDWRQVTSPVLALFGDLDMQVPVEQNRAPLEAALAEAGNADVTVVSLPTANHLFQNAKTGCGDEYPALTMEFVPGFLDTVGEWVAMRVGVTQ